MSGITHAIVALALDAGLGFSVATAPAALAGALLPDIDEPESAVSRILLGGRWTIFRVVGLALLAVALVWRGSVVRSPELLAMGLFLVAAALLPHRGVTHSVLGLALVALVLRGLGGSWFLPALLGYGSHLVADLPGSGVPLLWPVPWRVKVPVPRWLAEVSVALAAVAYLGYRGWAPWPFLR